MYLNVIKSEDLIRKKNRIKEEEMHAYLSYNIKILWNGHLFDLVKKKRNSKQGIPIRI